MTTPISFRVQYKLSRCTLMVLVAAMAVQEVGRAETSFNYQGELRENQQIANGSYDLEFSLWDTATDGNQIGSTVNLSGVEVVEGRFTVELDSGATGFDNAQRYLEVRVNATTLSPRQPITRVPYSIQTRGLFVDESSGRQRPTVQKSYLAMAVLICSMSDPLSTHLRLAI